MVKLKNLSTKTYFQIIGFLALQSCAFSIIDTVSDQLILGKYFYLFLISFPVMGIFVISILQQKILLYKNDVFLLIFLIYILINYLYNFDMFNVTIILWLESIMLCIVLRQAFGCLKHLKYFAIVSMLIVGTVQSCIGVLQLWGFLDSNNVYFKISGSFHNPGPYAIYLTIFFPLAFNIYVNNKHLEKNLLYYLSCVYIFTSLLVIPYTQSRTSWISVLCGALVAVYNTSFIKKFLNNLKFYFWLIIAAGLTMLALIVYIFNFKKDSIYGRLLSWKISLSVIKHNLMYGVGYGKFEKEFSIFQARYLNTHKDVIDLKLADRIYYAFNDYLQLTIEWGITGLILFLCIIFNILFFERKHYKESETKQPYISGIYGSLVTLLISALTSYPFENSPCLINLFILISMCPSTTINFNDNNYMINYISNSVIWIFFIVSLIVSCYSFVLIHDYNIAKRVETFSQLKMHKEAIREYNKISSNLFANEKTLLYYGKSLLEEKQYDKSLTVYQYLTLMSNDPYIYTNIGLILKAKQNYKLAEKSFLYASFLLPNRVYPKYLLVQLYTLQGNCKKARSVAEDVNQMTIKKENEITSQMIHEIQLELDRCSGKITSP